MSAILAPRLTVPNWRQPMLVLALVWLLLGWMYGDTVHTMWLLWNGSDSYAHAVLVPPISGWLVWRRRHELALLSPRPSPWMLLPLAAAALVWLLSDLAVVNSASHFAWVAMVILVVPAVMGLQVARTILFPLVFLLLAVPAGEFMLEPMMNWTADFTVAAVRLSGIPVYREGNQFIIPSGHWSVIEACAGVRYLISSFMVGALFAHLNYRSWQRRALFMLVAIIVPIVANWLRAYMIVMIGHLSGNTLAVGVDHLVYGWAFFGVVIIVMFMIGARWAEHDDEVDKVGRPGLAAGTAGRHGEPVSLLPLGLAALASLLVIATPHLALSGLRHIEGGGAAVQLQLPQQLSANWQASAAPVDAAESDFKPRFERPAAEQFKTYSSPQGQVTVYLAYYRQQNADSKLVSSVNKLLRSDDKYWNLVSSASRSVLLADTQVTMRTARLLAQARDQGRRTELAVWRTYWVDGHWVAGDSQAKVVTALTRLVGHGDDGATLVFWTDNTSTSAPQDVLQHFARDNLAELGQVLARAQAQR